VVHEKLRTARRPFGAFIVMRTEVTLGRSWPRTSTAFSRNSAQFQWVRLYAVDASNPLLSCAFQNHSPSTEPKKKVWAMNCTIGFASRNHGNVVGAIT